MLDYPLMPISIVNGREGGWREGGGGEVEGHDN